jgi:hypothetical protein
MADPRAARIESLLPRLATDPTVYLHSLDLERWRGLVLEVDRGFYRGATFLDERVLDPQRVGAWVPLERIWRELEARPAPRAPLGFIFHLGRAGSTLLSRLLDEVPGVLGLREPRMLRPLARAAAPHPQGELPTALARLLPMAHALLARRFTGDRAVVAKATSICNAIARPLLAQHPEDRAVALTVSLRAHLANALDKPPGEDQLGFAPHRRAVLAARVAGFATELEGQPPARLAALSWLAEVVAIAASPDGATEPRLRCFDFDALLADREATLAQVLGHLGLPTEPAAALAASPAFSAYSKQTDVRFGPDERRQVLERSWQANRDAIQDAEALVAALARRHPELARALAALDAASQPQGWPSGSAPR